MVGKSIQCLLEPLIQQALYIAVVRGRPRHRQLETAPRAIVGPYVTLSGGSAAAIPSAQESPDTLILGADSALYQAKTEGKNRIGHASRK